LAPHTLEFLETTGLPYLAKPFLVEELKLAVQRAFEASPSEGRTAAGGKADSLPVKPGSPMRDAVTKR